ncbi:hypothetical protein K1719_029868 [Acacia pycnantha]|nr:hypothetical protein K1719_029868 [Acacia pycnantha]
MVNHEESDCPASKVAYVDKQGLLVAAWKTYVFRSHGDTWKQLNSGHIVILLEKDLSFASSISFSSDPSSSSCSTSSSSSLFPCYGGSLKIQLTQNSLSHAIDP